MSKSIERMVDVPIWTPEERLEIARRHLLKAASEAEERGWMATHKAILMSLAALDDAKESAYDPR